MSLEIEPADWIADAQIAARLVEPMIKEALEAQGLLPLSTDQMAIVLAAIEGGMLAIIIALRNEIDRQRNIL